MKRFELDHPIRHPKYIIDHTAYKERVYRIMAWRHPWIKVVRSFEELYLNLRHGDGKTIRKALTNRINKWFNRQQYN